MRRDQSRDADSRRAVKDGEQVCTPLLREGKGPDGFPYVLLLFQDADESIMGTVQRSKLQGSNPAARVRVVTTRRTPNLR